MERTYKVKQSDIREAVDIQSANKGLDLSLKEMGPYCMDYSRNGSHMLLGGRKGHVAMLEWKTSRKITELYLGETVRDCVFLQDHTMFAVAQKKYVFVYDSQGTELHCMRKHIRPSSLRYLPYHWLLASVGRSGFLKYQDLSTGQLVAEHRTRLGPCDVTALNPWNAIMNLGHANGWVLLFVWQADVMCSVPCCVALCQCTYVTERVTVSVRV
jgi:U3 small nucleolar RNA-associated protein 7